MKITNKHYILTTLIAATGMLPILGPNASAAPIAVPDYSFETGLSGWNNTAEGTAGTFAPGSAGPTAPDGSNIAYVYGNNDGNAEEMTSSASLATITANTTYTLNVYVAEPDQAQSPNNFNYVTGGTANIALLAGGTSFVSQTSISSVGSFTEETLTFTTGSSDAIIGQSLTIQLGSDAYTGFGGDGGNGGYPNVNFDDVSLDGSPAGVAAVPEPSSIAMLFGGLGIVGMLLRRRRLQS